MLYDPSNPVVQLCVKGIETEYGGDLLQADALYRKAWKLASNDLEFLTAAHYLARTQTDAGAALKWNLLALDHARKVDEVEVASFLPSLYLNVAKSYEDLEDFGNARAHYQAAQDCTPHLAEDGYGEMIRKGITAGLERLRTDGLPLYPIKPLS